jgi:hypothetical protein
MTFGANRWRRLAARLAEHAARVLPGAQTPWAQAMRRELDYIEDDATALRWALGCILASYRTRLADRLRLRVQTSWRHAAASGALMLVIGLALQEHAGGQTEPPRPAFDESACDAVKRSPQIRPDPVNRRTSRAPTELRSSPSCQEPENLGGHERVR